MNKLLLIAIILSILVVAFAKQRHVAKKPISTKRSTLVNIGTCAQFKAQFPGLTSVDDLEVHLTDNIDCGGEELGSGVSFAESTFNGHGFALRNFTVKGSLFSIVTNVQFSDLKLLDFAVTMGDVTQYTGLISNDGSVVQLTNIAVDATSPAGNTVRGTNKVGSLVGSCAACVFDRVHVRKTYVEGSDSVGGIAGAISQNTVVVECRNYGFEKAPSTPIVKGVTNVGGLFGYSEVTSIKKSGVENGEVLGINKVGSIVGLTVNAPELSEIYSRPQVLVKGTGNDASVGGLVGTYKVESSGNFLLINSYSKADVTSTGMVNSNAGGLIGNVYLDPNFDIDVTFSHSYAFSDIHGDNGAFKGILFGFVQYIPANHTLTVDELYCSNDTNSGIDFTGKVQNTRGSPFSRRVNDVPAGIEQYEYVDMVDHMIDQFDIDNVWCHDRLRIESEFYRRHNVCRCGINSPEYEGTGEPLCLCSHFTELSNFNESFCINSTRVCTPPDAGYVTTLQTLTLDISVIDVWFDDQGRLSVIVDYATIVTGWTDIIVTGGGDYKFIASLSTFLDGRPKITGNLGQEDWDQNIDKYDGPCRQLVTFQLPWSAYDQVTYVAQDAFESGNFSFFIFADTNIVREKTTVVVKRDVATHPANLITAVPLYIHLNTTILTNATVTSNFTLGFDIDILYYVRETDIDVTGTNLTVVLRHTVSNPFSLEVSSTSALVGGNTLTVTRLSETTVNCPADFDLEVKPSRCEEETTFVITLDAALNCTDQTVAFTFFMDIRCDGPNENTTSTLCASVYDQIPVKDATATVSFDYNFCPKVEDTALVAVAFNISQYGALIPEKGEVEEEDPITIVILYDVIRDVNGSVFNEGHISSVKLFETQPGPNSAPFLDLTGKVVAQPVVEYDTLKLSVTFNYTTDFRFITTYLQEWFKGLYFEVEVDIAYKPPAAKRSVGDNTYKSSVRLELFSENMQSIFSAPRSERVFAEGPAFTLKRENKTPIVKAHPVASKNNNAKNGISDALRAESERANNMMTIIGASVGTALLVVVACVVVVVSIFLKNRKN